MEIKPYHSYMGTVQGLFFFLLIEYCPSKKSFQDIAKGTGSGYCTKYPQTEVEWRWLGIEGKGDMKTSRTCGLVGTATVRMDTDL